MNVKINHEASPDKEGGIVDIDISEFNLKIENIIKNIREKTIEKSSDVIEHLQNNFVDAEILLLAGAYIIDHLT